LLGSLTEIRKYEIQRRHQCMPAHDIDSMYIKIKAAVFAYRVLLRFAPIFNSLIEAFKLLQLPSHYETLPTEYHEYQPILFTCLDTNGNSL